MVFLSSLRGKLFFLFLFALFIGQAQSQLQFEEEECERGWEGENCLLFDQQVVPEKEYSTYVPSGRWKIFPVEVTSLLSVIATVTQASSDAAVCDVDIYVQKSGYPNRASYLARDVESETISYLDVPNAFGTYYFGIYGYKGCDFTFSYELSTVCGMCQNGECVAHANLCQCYNGFAGVNCDKRYDLVQSGDRRSKFHAKGWEHFGLLTSSNPYRVKFELMLSGNGDDTHESDLYVATGRLPSLYDYDYVTPLNVEETVLDIVVAQPLADTIYFFSVHSRESSTYSVGATEYPAHTGECINHCSSHGFCSDGGCECIKHFSGLSCETMRTPFPVGELTEGYVDKGAWNFYYLKLDTQNQISIHVVQKEEDADCDLYVKETFLPNFVNFDLHDFSTESELQLTIPSPGSSEWHIGVYGYSACEYEISIAFDNSCSCPHGAKGSCSGNSKSCICDDGWVGAGCKSPLHPLTSGRISTQNVMRNEWSYFRVYIPKAVGFSVAVKERDTEGFLWVFLGMKEIPTLSTFEVVDRNQSAVHQIDLQGEYSDNEVIIGVYGNSYSMISQIPFQIVVWHTNF